MTLVDPPRTSVAIDVTRTGPFSVVQPRGSLARGARKQLEDSLLELEGEPLVLLDLSEVSTLDAGVVGMLVRLRARGIPLRCIDPSPAAQSVLSATGASLVLGLSPA